METRSARRKKLCHAYGGSSPETACGEDRITDLPDVILHRILILLPIRSIAQTSVLSKRWRHIWLSFPDLDFTTIKTIDHDDDVDETSTKKRAHSRINSNGMDVVSNVLSLRDKNSDIRILRVGASLSCTQLNGLIRSAVRHNVQELDIEAHTNDCFNFPRSVSTSNSLRIFKLKSLSSGLRLPPSTIMKDGFQSLQTLSLTCVIFEKKRCLLDLFTDSSFPLLKKLNLDLCIGLNSLSVCCRSLVELTLENCCELNDLNVHCPKLEELIVSRCFSIPYGIESFVKIDAPKLRKIGWTSNGVTDNSSLENLTSLHEAAIGIDFDVLYKSLILHNRGIQETLKSQAAGFILKSFVNLKSLELSTESIQGLGSIFKSSIALKKLIIKITSENKQRKLYRDLFSYGGEQHWESQSEALEPFLQHLRVVKIFGISECEDEVNLVKFLLGHARVLQEMVISCCSSAGDYSSKGYLRLNRIKYKVKGFSRVSSDATIVFQ